MGLIPLPAGVLGDAEAGMERGWDGAVPRGWISPSQHLQPFPDLLPELRHPCGSSPRVGEGPLGVARGARCLPPQLLCLSFPITPILPQGHCWGTVEWGVQGGLLCSPNPRWPPP